MYIYIWLMYFIERICVWFSAETVLFGDGAKIKT